MARSNIYAGLEIGTSKICVVVGEVKTDGAIKILGVGQAPSRGVRKGEIVDYGTVQRCLHDALVRAEDLSDVMIRNVFLSVTGAHIQSLNNRGCIQIPEGQSEVSENDLQEVKEIARDVDIPSDHVFIHSIIQHYYVDGQDQVVDPVGRLGKQLEADYHIIHGIRNRVQNAIKCVREIPLEVEDVVFAAIASAQVVLKREAKKAGALLIDIGGGTSDYVLYKDGVVTKSGCVAVGGDHLTNDLSLVLKIPIAKAETLKVEEGNADPGREETGDSIFIPPDTSFEGSEVERDFLNEIVQARFRETFDLIKKRIKEDGDLDCIGSGVTLTGGTSLLNGIDKLAEDVFGLPVHCASSQPVSGLTATFENPKYATAIGLIRYAQIIEGQNIQEGGFGWLKKVFNPQKSLGSFFS